MKFKPRRSSPRLTSFDYMGDHAYHLVFSTADRLPRFRDGRLVASCLECLAASATRHRFNINAYCFMPDHLHLLITGSDDASLARFAQHFKQATGYRRPGLWQRSYYDHILRREESLESIALYIWANPVRAGMVEDIVSYSYSGPREQMVGYGKPAADDQDRAEALSLQALTNSRETEEVPSWKP